MNTKSWTLAATLLLLTATSCTDRTKEFDASGVFEATEVTVSAEGNGNIIEFSIQEGDRVSVGDTLGCIDTTQLHLNKLQLQANIVALNSGRYDVSLQIASLKQQLAKQKKELARFTKLAKAGASGQKQVEDIKAQIDILQKELNAQTQNLRNANSGIAGKTTALEAQVLQVDDMIDKCIIKSPIDGVILAKYAQEGELAAQGRPLFKIADTEDIRLRAYITAGQLTDLKLGQQVKVYADQGEHQRREYAGKLVWISEQAEFTPKTIQTRDERANLVYAVKIAVKNDGLIKLGMYGEVKF